MAGKPAARIIRPATFIDERVCCVDRSKPEEDVLVMSIEASLHVFERAPDGVTIHKQNDTATGEFSDQMAGREMAAGGGIAAAGHEEKIRRSTAQGRNRLGHEFGLRSVGGVINPVNQGFATGIEIGLHGGIPDAFAE